jgi:hypothetical protein
MNAVTTQLERESLEAHVDLCAMRYSQLEMRLNTMDVKIDNLASKYESGNTALIKAIVISSGSIVAGLLSLALAIFMRGM